MKMIADKLIACSDPGELLRLRLAAMSSSMSEGLGMMYLLHILYRTASASIQKRIRSEFIPTVEHGLLTNCRRELPQEVFKYSRTIETMVRTWEKQRFVSPSIVKMIRDLCSRTTLSSKKKRPYGIVVQQQSKRVVIWDLDETLLVFNSLTNGTFAKHFNKDADTARSLGQRMVQTILDVLEHSLFFNDLDVNDIVHIDDIQRYDDELNLIRYDFPSDGLQDAPDRMLKLAYRYRRIRQIYQKQYKIKFTDTESKDYKSIHQLVEQIDSFTDGWLAAARRAVEATAAHGCINVLVTNSQLVPAVCKCMIYGFDQYFQMGHIYSGAHIGKLACFERILTSLDDYPISTYCAVGDGPEEAFVARKLQLEFIKVRHLELPISNI